ncbi:MAG: hypothetical protein M3Q07_23920, partial [Pseudobdellovibrionaceae bacterium]|nr:hypothetical protein [Pseudobdellovibrionaceae bacterium]
MTPRLPFNLLLMFTLLWSAQAWGHAAHCPQVDKGLQYNLVDQEGAHNIPPTNKVEWKIFRGQSLDLNFTSQTLWVKIQWLSKAPGEQKCILVVDYPFLDKITLYEWADTSWAAYHSGDRSPTSDAIAYARHPSFVFQSAPGPNVIYLKVTTRGLLRLPLEVYDYESGHQSFVTKSIISAALLGAICLIIVYSLSLFLTSREPSIFFYAILQTLVLYK